MRTIISVGLLVLDRVVRLISTFKPGYRLDGLKEGWITFGEPPISGLDMGIGSGVETWIECRSLVTGLDSGLGGS
jgi:hypothetical protein